MKNKFFTRQVCDCALLAQTCFMRKRQRRNEEKMLGETVHIANNSLDLGECKDLWEYDARHKCWCLEDIIYTDKATTPKFQRLSIFVPAEYMSAKGVINENGSRCGYTSKTAPVILANNSAGYKQMPHVWLDGPRCRADMHMEHGFVYVSCGNRGSESRDENGKQCGKAPINLIDLKTVVRFLRHNRDFIPGNLDRIVSTGWSAGGAMSMLLGVTGDNKNYNSLLEEAGAFMDESDAIFASQCYCPIIDLEHADLAYEWMFHEDKQCENSPAGPAELMSPFKDALSEKLKEKYISYFNSLGLKDDRNSEALSFESDGRSGTAYEYLMNKLNEAASVFLDKLDNGGFERDGEKFKYSSEDYLKGNYTYLTPAPMGPKDDKPDKHSHNMQGFAGRGVALAKADNAPNAMPLEPPTLGDMLSRPPKGVEFRGEEPPMINVSGDDKSEWLEWDGKKATVKDLDTYILNHRRRMKPCTSFDTLNMDSGENQVFGSASEPFKHFNADIADEIAALKDEFPDEYNKYYAAYSAVKNDSEQLHQIYLTNPLNFIGTAEESEQAKHFRIRVGTKDADTSFSVAMTAALKLANAGNDTDYALVWDMPHCEADYDGEFVAWIESIVGKEK